VEKSRQENDEEYIIKDVRMNVNKERMRKRADLCIKPWPYGA